MPSEDFLLKRLDSGAGFIPESGVWISGPEPLPTLHGRPHGDFPPRSSSMKNHLYLVLTIVLMVVIIFQYMMGAVAQKFERELFGRLLRSLQHQADQGNTREAMIVLESISRVPTREEMTEANEKFGEIEVRQREARQAAAR